MIAQYRINAAGKTESGASLSNPFYLVVNNIIVTTTEIGFEVSTYEGQDEQFELGSYENIPNKVISYPYTPATDNAKSVNQLLTDNFEASLTTWVGANWTKL